MNSISLASYSNESVDSPEKATIVATAIEQTGISTRALFHILQHTNLLLDEALTEGNFSDTDKLKIKFPEKTFKIIKTSFSVSNLKVYREVVDMDTSKLLFNPLSLHDRDINVTDVDFNITGSILETNDPMNLYIENIFIDAYNLRNAFNVLAFCNYPGAYKGGEIVAKNITVTMSSQKSFVFSTVTIFSYLLGDATFDGVYFKKFYMDLDHMTSTLIAFVFPF